VLFLTATSIGLLAGMTRNVASMAVAAFLILAVFLLATIVGTTSLMDLFVAILGFNAGLINLMAVTAVMQTIRHA
jgi:hypothetical protein